MNYYPNTRGIIDYAKSLKLNAPKPMNEPKYGQIMARMKKDELDYFEARFRCRAETYLNKLPKGFKSWAKYWEKHSD